MPSKKSRIQQAVCNLKVCVCVFVLPGQDHGDDAAKPVKAEAFRVLAQCAVHAVALLEHLAQRPLEWTRMH